ncbi:MAG: glycoside hydrolase family 2 TIM barrel-domain containing protein [Candidatus Omnitrophota bacterium]
MLRKVPVMFLVMMLWMPLSVWAQQDNDATAAPVVSDDLASSTYEELTRLAWDALNRADFPEVDRIFEMAVKLFEPQAMMLHAGLKEFPGRDRMAEYRVMNDVATIHFVRLESLRTQGKSEAAIDLAKDIIRKYPYAQAWDASRGGFWSIAEKSQIIMDQLSGVTEEREELARNAKLTHPVLAFPGKDKVIDYTKYGKFIGLGTKDYKYKMNKPSVLAEAAGEGVFPNTVDVIKDPRYREVYKEGRMSGSHWDMVNTRDLEAAYYKWASAAENPGVKLFYTALVLERSQMYLEAIKAYHALIVHFPRSWGMTYWQTPWYPAQAAVAKIKNIIRMHPELNLEFTGAKVRVINGADNDTANDIFIVNPGVIKEVFWPFKKNDVIGLGKVKRTLGGNKVKFVQYENGHWQMMVENKPYTIHGLTYTPTKIGQSPDKGTLENWMFQTDDSMHQAWVDKNRNNIQDPNEPNVGDFKLMQEMGVNTIRIYHNKLKMNTALLRELHQRYGIRVIMGDFLGKYTLGSGADWKTGTDYENPVHLQNMMKEVEDFVKEFKDEDFVLMWLLGNENNYGVASNADKKPEAYFKFVNQVAKRIKEIDPNHPVAICNGDVLFLDKMARFAPDVDAYGANIYRGDYGFGSYWDEVRETADRPAFITEYGAPAYSKFASLEEAEEDQSRYHQGGWMDIMANTAGHAEGAGNAIGGIAFEWMDEWWKNYEPFKHDTKADVIGPFAGGYYFEEWFGLVGQGDGTKSPLLRQLRKVYYNYKTMWNKK